MTQTRDEFSRLRTTIHGMTTAPTPGQETVLRILGGTADDYDRVRAKELEATLRKKLASDRGSA